MKKQLLKNVSAILVLLLVIGFWPIGSYAAAPGSSAGQISAASLLNVRSSASVSSAIIATLSNGSYVTLLSKSGDWWSVEYGKNLYGYCSAKYIDEISGSYSAYTTASLNIRSGPDTSYDIINWLSSGEYVVVLSTSGDWKKILFNGVKIGYVKAFYLSTASADYSSVYLNVPDYKQFDSRWAYVEVGSSGSTIKSIGCVTSSIAMIESYRTGKTIYPDEMESKLNYTSSGAVYWPSGYYAYTGSDYLSVAYKLLKSGTPVMIGLKNNYGNQHWVVITGYNGASSLSASAFSVNDPASSYNKTLQDVINSYPYFYKLMHP